MLGWVIPSLFASAIAGSIYILASLGLTLTMAVMKLPNFAHTQFLAIGGYVAVLVSIVYPGNFVLIGISAFLICSLVAIVVHYSVFKPLMKRRSSIYSLLLASFAVSLFIEYTIFVFATAENLLQVQPHVSIFVITYIGSAPITNLYIIAVPLAIFAAIALSVYMTFTVMGQSMSAVASNADLARVVGIRFSRVVNLMWILAGGLAGLGGAFFGLYTTVTPFMGTEVLLDVFAVVVVAGLTSIIGTVIGGFVVGIAENTIMQALHNFFGVSLLYEPLVPFMLIIVILLVKPSGIVPKNIQSLLRLKSKIEKPRPIAEK